mgnify:CR=1 FL=1
MTCLPATLGMGLSPVMVGNATIDGMHFQYDLFNGVYDLPISVWDAIVDVFGTSAKDEVKKELQDIIVEGIVQPRVMSKP